MSSVGKTFHSILRRSRIVGAATGAGLLLAGCASFSSDAGMSAVSGFASQELGKEVVKLASPADQEYARGQVQRLLAGTLSADNAVQIALLNNRGLQARYNDVGVSEAQYVQASLPPNPTVSLARLVTTGTLEIERTLLVNVLSLLTLHKKTDIAEKRYRQTQLAAMEATLALAADTRRTYYRAVASSQIVDYLEEARLTAEALSELTMRLGETGAINRITQAREHVFYAEVGAQLASAKLVARSERDRLARLMGLWGQNLDFHLPRKLKALPGSPMRRIDVELDAVSQRVDLMMAFKEIEILSRELDLTEATRFVPMLELFGFANTEFKREVNDEGEVETEKERWRGGEVEFQVPIFDHGQARTKAGHEAYMRAVNLLVDKAVNVRGEAREAYTAYRGRFDIAHHYEKNILPLRKVISDEVLLEYNGMISDPSQILIDQRGRIASNVAAIEARRDFWLANVDLHVAVVGGGAPSGAAEAITVAAGGGGEGH